MGFFVLFDFLLYENMPLQTNKRDYTVEKEARREDTRRKRQERVMCAYVKHAHPAVYKEMCDVYNDLNERYPKTRDLRKTAHFMHLRRTVVKEREASQKNTHEFSLRIPLMKATTTTTTTLTPAATVSPPVAVLPPPPTVSSPPHAPTVSSPPHAPTVSSPPPAPTVSPPSVAVLPPVPDDTYQGLLEQLRKDPDLWQIFQDFPGEEMDPFVAEDLGDISDISPLEDELS